MTNGTEQTTDSDHALAHHSKEMFCHYFFLQTITRRIAEDVKNQVPPSLRHTILASRELMWCYACSWDVRGELTLNSMAQIHTSVALLASRDLAWRSGRFTCQHPSQISAVAHVLWNVTYVSSALRTLPVVPITGGNAYWKSAPTDPFYMTPSHQIIEISIWEPTHGKGQGRSWK